MTCSASAMSPQLVSNGAIEARMLFLLPILSTRKILSNGAAMSPIEKDASSVEVSSVVITILEFGCVNSARLGEFHPMTVPEQNVPVAPRMCIMCSA